ncbi:MAG: polyprenyl synthetase family protein [Vampirovibrionales bacterium]
MALPSSMAHSLPAASSLADLAKHVLPDDVQAALVQVQERLSLLGQEAESSWLTETLAHTLGTPGKLLRPTLCLLAGQATGGLVPAHIQTATVAEMIHVATLLHDDVLDDAELRRNRPTARTRWGNTVSILSGDYLLAEASRLLAQTGHIRLVSIFSDVLADLCSGEIEQLRTQRQWPTNPQELTAAWASYHQKTLCKTASLFAAACESGGWINGLNDHQLQALKLYGQQLGLAFQLVDDGLDYNSTVQDAGKPVMGDIQQGLVTAPVLLALESERLTDPQRQELGRLVQHIFVQTAQPSSNRTPLSASLQELQHLVQQSGAEALLLAKAEAAIESAVTALELVCSPSASRQALVLLAQGSVTRTR